MFAINERGIAMTETALRVFAAVGPFSDDLMRGGSGLTDAITRLAALTPLDAVRLVLAATRRTDAVIGDRYIDDLAEELGVFEEDVYP